MKMSKNSLFAVACMLLALLVAGCKSKQLPQPSTEQSASYTVQQVLTEQPTFETLHISKMNVVATYGTQQLSFRATVKLLPDSLLVLSIQPMLGVEMFRVEFTPSRFVVVDKWNRRYTDNSYDFLRYKLGVDFRFDVLQNILSNRLFLLDKTEVSVDDFAVEIMAGAPTQLLHLAPGLIQQFEVVEPAAIAKASVAVEQGRLLCEYAGHRLQNGVRFPNMFAMTLLAAGRVITLSCTVEKMEFNKPIEYVPQNLARYEQVTFSKIIP
ncbi:MAG: DUF4292 domain-containing protein [Paludibacteraceae bacterium]